MSLPCTYALLNSLNLCILWLHNTIDIHTPSFRFFMFTIKQVFLVNPKMMSDLILLSHTDLPPVILVLFPQSLRIQNMSTDNQLARAYNPLNLDGFVSPCHPHAVTQICHWVCPFFHCTSHLKRAEANLTPSWDVFLGTLFIHVLFHIFTTWMLKVIFMLSYPDFWENTPKAYIHLCAYSFTKIGINCSGWTANLNLAVLKCTEYTFVLSIFVYSVLPKFW